MLAQYIGENPSDFRLFPKLTKWSLNAWMCHLREKYQNKRNEVPWLYDVWQTIKGYDSKGKLIWTKNRYRIAPHAGRANYNTAAYIVSDKDIEATRKITGYDHTDDLEPYLRTFGLMEKRMKIREKFMDDLLIESKIPLLIGQTKLDRY